jgi:O-antigen/teichoic acid export membrane protein
MFHNIIKNAGTYSIAMLAGRAIGFILLPVYTRYLTPSDYGVMELLDLTVNLAGLLVGARLGQALFYFYFSADTQEDKEQCISTAFFGSVILGCACSVIALLGGSTLSQIVFGTARYGGYFRLVFFGLGLSMPVEMGYCCMRTFGQSGRYVRANLCYLIGTAILNLVLLIAFRWGVAAMLTSSVIGFAVAAGYVTWYVLWPIKVSLDFGLLWRQIRYAIPLGLSGLAVFFVHYGDRIFLRYRISLDELGVYSLAYKIGMLISFCHAPFVLHWNSQVCSILKAPDGDRVYVRSLTYLMAGLCAMVVVLSLAVQPVLHLLVTPGFYGAGALVPWLAAAYLIRSLGAHLQSVFTAEGKPGLEARVNTVGSIACLAAYALLIPPFKLWGAVAATLVGFFVTLCYGFWEAQRLRRFCFEYGKLVRITLFTAAALFAFFLLRPTGFWSESSLAVLLCIGHAFSMLFGCFDQEERDSLINMIVSLRPKRTSPDSASARRVSVI